MDADDPQPGSEAFTDAARWLCSYGREDTSTPAEGTRHGLRLRALAPRHHQLSDLHRLRAQLLPARQQTRLEGDGRLNCVHRRLVHRDVRLPAHSLSAHGCVQQLVRVATPDTQVRTPMIKDLLQIGKTKV